jgi:hypothetical protein
VKLEGSCRCGQVQFSCEAYAPVPYLRCYCSICRKTAGGGGYAINLGARAATLTVKGRSHVRVYRAMIDGERSSGERHYCRHCATFLWVSDPRWPELVHPFASAIDTPLPQPPETVHIMLKYKPAWVDVPAGAGHVQFDEYPDESLEDWHRRHGLYDAG